MSGDDERPGLDLDELATGPNAHGYGRTADGRELAFRVRASTVLLEVYRDGAPALPAPEDVEAGAARPVGSTDLHDEDALRALVADVLAAAGPVEQPPTATVKSHLGRVGSVMDIL